jgi:ElaB/YqjD/DUF883 family membrane-anchored ribosome-binding protein
MSITSQSSDAKEKLVSGLQAVIRDAEELLKNTSQQTDEGYRAAKEKFQTTLDSAKSGLDTAQDSIYQRTKDAASNTDKYVQENPWKSVAVSVFAGMVVGLLIGRK